MNSLSKTVTRQRRGCDLNPGPSLPESSTLTTRLPSNPINAVRGELIELWAYVPLHRFLRQFHWLPVQRRVEFKIACLAHHSITSTAPTYLSADIQLVSEHGSHHLRSSFYRTLAVPRTCTTLGDRSFAVAGPRVWNSLLATIRQITSYGQLRQHLKTHLFRAQKLHRIATLDYCALYKYSYLLAYLLTK